MQPQEQDFEFPRGDTCPLLFGLTDENGNTIQLKNSDELYFTVKKNYNTRETIIQKRYSLSEIIEEENGFKLIILPNDTNRLNYGTYVYDICIKSGDLTKTLCLGQITLTNEATFISNE